jgi:hypothetical protein
VDQAALASGGLRVPVFWSVNNRPENSNLVFEQVLPDNTAVNVELPRDTAYVPSTGTGVVAPFLPAGEVTEIKLRVRLLKLPENAVLDTRELRLPVAAPADQKPAITTFTTSIDRVDRTALAEGWMEVPVSWTTANRPNNANLVFEQVMPDGSAVNVERPREVSYVPSAGTGPVAPRLPAGEVTEIKIRVRLVSLATNATLDTREIRLPINAASDQAPIVTTFLVVGNTQVERSSLTSGSARVRLLWGVKNRSERLNTNTNLLFEQVMPDGSAVNVELPREVSYVPSYGEGDVVPRLPAGEVTEIKIRVRLVSLATNATLDTRELRLPIVAVASQTPAIPSFVSGNDRVERGPLLAGSARIPLTWAVENRPANSNLFFEQVLPNGTAINVELPRTVANVPSAGSGLVAPRFPGNNVNEIRLRVRLVNLRTNITLVTREMRIPVISTNGSAPAILVFTAGAERIDRAALAAGAARVTVSWAADNRPDNTNLVFEQVLPNDRIVNVELPRSLPYVPTVGSGVVAPLVPGSTVNEIRLRVRLISLTGNTTLDTREIRLPIAGGS